ncbi:MAG: tetratricopeptide repeat protein [Candidatus Eisenbacteria bacterium]
MKKGKKKNRSRKSPASKTWTRSRLGAILIALMVCLVYFPCVFNGFIWDDAGNIYENPALTQPGGLSRIWGSFDLYQYYPLTFTSFYLEHKLWGMSPSGYHVTNVLLHAVNAILVLLLLQRLGLRWPLALFTASLFAVHPIQAESVAWSTERKNLLSGCFYFSSFLLYLKFLETRKARDYGLSLLTFTGALLSKTVTLTLAMTLLVWETVRAGSIRVKSLLRVSVFFALGSAPAVMTAFLETHRFGSLSEEWSHPLAQRIIVVPRVLLFYASKIILPVNMSFIYPQWKIDPALPLSYWPAALWAGLLALLWWQRKRIPTLAWFGLGHYVVTLLPASGLVNFYFLRYSFVQNHFQYLAGLGIMILIALAGEEVVKRIAGVTLHAKAGWFLGAAVLIGCGIMTFRECRIYRDEQTLWSDTITRNPHAWLAYNNLGKVLAKQGRSEEGARLFRKTLEIDPGFAEAHVNLGLYHLRRGDVDGAITSLEAAVAVRPGFAVAHRNLGDAYGKKRMYDKAIGECEKALDLEPNHGETYLVLGVAHHGKGALDQAAEAYRRAIAIKPDLAVAHYNLGLVHRDGGRLDEAAAEFERAIAANPVYVEALNELGNTYLRKGDPARALTAYERSLAIDPNQMGTHYNLGVACQGAGRPDEAVSHFNRALAIQPNFAPAHIKLAELYLSRGEHGQAIAHSDRAAELGQKADPELLRLLEPHRRSR